jgi:sugar/nucleoside kinase (ribokinase family)
MLTSDRGVAPQLRPSEMDGSWLELCDVLHVSGYCLFTEPIASPAIHAVGLAREVTVDLVSADGIRAVGAPAFCARLDALPRPATEFERAALAGHDARWVVKLGARGAIFPEEAYCADSTEPVDTTGAGDALAAGYLVGGLELAMRAAAR